MIPYITSILSILFVVSNAYPHCNTITRANAAANPICEIKCNGFGYSCSEILHGLFGPEGSRGAIYHHETSEDCGTTTEAKRVYYCGHREPPKPLKPSSKVPPKSPPKALHIRRRRKSVIKIQEEAAPFAERRASSPDSRHKEDLPSTVPIVTIPPGVCVLTGIKSTHLRDYDKQTTWVSYYGETPELYNDPELVDGALSFSSTYAECGFAFYKTKEPLKLLYIIYVQNFAEADAMVLQEAMLLTKWLLH